MPEGFNWEHMDMCDAAERLRHEGYRAKDYTGDKCKNCGRMRVMNCRNGKHVCEKCGWDSYTNQYDPHYKPS